MSRFRKAKYQQVHQATLLDEEEDDTTARDFKTLNLKSTERVGKKFSLSSLLGAGRKPSASGSADDDGYDALTSPDGAASSNPTQQTTTAQNQTDHRQRARQGDDNNDDAEFQGGVKNSIKDLISSACVIADLFKDIKEQAAGSSNSELETELRGQATAIQSQIAEILQADTAPDEESLITALALNDTLIELLQDRKVDGDTSLINQQGSQHQESSPSPSPSASGEEQAATTEESMPPSMSDLFFGEPGPQATEQQPQQPALCEEPPLIEL